MLAHRHVGTRREGLFTATMSFLRNILAIFVNVAIALIGVAGIDTTVRAWLHFHFFFVLRVAP
jgi:hypothetical protein